MRCPYCGAEDSKVIDSREVEGGAEVRRRRECPTCHRRFTTYERYERKPLRVIKKNGTRELFDRKKILNGLMKACEKRPVSSEELERIVDDIERELQEEGYEEVPSSRIGEKVMEKLKALDQVAYVRFASVYREFRDIDQFMEIVLSLSREQNASKGESV
ncbi:transcriptional regulator NrdR [Candidatus Caldatribacterium saccharofermentans]|uniref:transcriptional regulator NrdR n=1 Tax=Candidatus Caldatribacterium saccharofermentans TaxID=1454753 RepID=UPI003D02B857